MDGHDKFMGYQNGTFSLAVYGCMDTASRKLFFIPTWASSSNPVYPGRCYMILSCWGPLWIQNISGSYKKRQRMGNNNNGYNNWPVFSNKRSCSNNEGRDKHAHQ